MSGERQGLRRGLWRRAKQWQGRIKNEEDNKLDVLVGEESEEHDTGSKKTMIDGELDDDDDVKRDIRVCDIG